jgi:4-nitrophenyl phosphatase
MRPDLWVLCDLDGVIWLAHEAIDGSADAVDRLRAAGATVLFVTNNSFSTIAEQEAALAAVGIDAVGAVLTSPQAAALLLPPQTRAMVVGGAGIFEALGTRGVHCIDAHEPDLAALGATGAGVDAVVVGIDRRFDYETLRRASDAVRAGARLIGTNADSTYPTPNGPVPGGGAMLAAIATASGVVPTVAGKPHEPMAALVRARIGLPDSLADELMSEPGGRRAVWMVGDRPDTDGAFARLLGCSFGLVLSGVTAPGDVADPPGDLVAADLAAMATTLLANA